MDIGYPKLGMKSSGKRDVGFEVKREGRRGKREKKRRNSKSSILNFYQKAYLALQRKKATRGRVTF
jgi:hypothetical protein